MKTRISVSLALLLCLVLPIVVNDAGSLLAAGSPLAAGTALADDGITVVFREDFNGSSLDPNIWQAFDNGGGLQVANGFVSLSNNGGNGLPYVYLKTNPFPSGDFSVKVGIQYIHPRELGSGFQISDAIQNDGEVGTGLLGVWQDLSSFRMTEFLNSDGEQTLVSYPAPDTNSHTIEFMWLTNFSVIILDGNVIYTVENTPVVQRPVTVWFGNPGGVNAGPWTDLKIDYIEIDSRPPAGIVVPVDIKPGSDANTVNCSNPNALIPVAILSTPDFDARTVDNTNVIFEGAMETHKTPDGQFIRHEEDANGDGLIDLVFHFRLGNTYLTCSSTQGSLYGSTLSGLTGIHGTDTIHMISKR